MKKIIPLCLALTLCLLLGCGQKTTDETVLRVGMDLKFPPFSDMDAKGNPIGFEPTIAQAFGDYLGCQVEIVNTDFSLLIPALETGDVDILIADMSETAERAQKADFSDPYRYSYTLALVNKNYADANQITSDMNQESFFHLGSQAFIGLAGTMGVLVPQSFDVAVTEATEIGSAIMEVSSGTATALVASNEIHAYHAANPDTTVVYSGIEAYTASSFVVKKGDADLLEQANAFIETMYEPGGLYEEIDQEYDEIIGDFLQNDQLGLEYIIYPPAS